MALVSSLTLSWPSPLASSRANPCARVEAPGALPAEPDAEAVGLTPPGAPVEGDDEELDVSVVEPVEPVAPDVGAVAPVPVEAVDAELDGSVAPPWLEDGVTPKADWRSPRVIT
jgi:hypothetical protein